MDTQIRAAAAAGLNVILVVDQAPNLHSACHSVTRFDSIDMHPYSPKGPHWHALSANDITVPDIYRLNRALAAAQRLHHVAPGGRKSVIVTEFSWTRILRIPTGSRS